MPQSATPLRFASALSQEADTRQAVEAVTRALAGRMPGADLVTVFVTRHHAERLALIHEHLASGLNAQVTIGATGEAVLGQGTEVEEGPGLSVLAASLPGATVQAFAFEPADWGRVLQSPQSLRAEITVSGVQPRCVLLLPDPFTTPMLRLLPLLHEALPDLPICGGMASASREPGGNRLLANGQVLAAGAVGAVLSGDIRADTTVSQGCRAIGKPLVITKAQRHIVQELGGRNALEVLRELVGNLSEEDRTRIQTHGLLVGRVINEYKSRFGRGDFLIRSLLGFQEETGCFAIADPQIRVGQTIQFHVRDQRTAREDFELLLEVQKLHGGEGGALLFSCNGRGRRLFDEPHTDPGIIQRALGDMPLAGFFAAGEIGPVGGQTFLHGHTASLVVFRRGDA